MRLDDISYFKKRVEVETERARRAASPSVVKAHAELARVYREKLASLFALQSGVDVGSMGQGGNGSSPSEPLSSRLNRNRIWNRFLGAEERKALNDALLPAKVIPRGADIVHAGASVDTLLIVAKGWACRYMDSSDGARHMSGLCVPGDLCNIDSLMFDRPNFGIRTLTRAIILCLPRERAMALAADHPGIAKSFLWLAVSENAILSKWAQSLARRSAVQRLAHLFCELNVRLANDNGAASSFALPLTQSQLGEALGLTPVHVNRTLQQLRSEGLVETSNRRITLLDEGGLRQLSGFDPSYLHGAGAE